MPEPRSLRRELRLGGAVVTGLGSILGTGVFVSIAVAAGFAGSWIVLALPVAALVATFNGLSSAQLAAVHPVSGGTYEYGYAFLGPWFGFSAGWLFLVAKTASAATAALGFAGYLRSALDIDTAPTLASLAAVAGVTLLVLSGVRRTAGANLVLVGLTVASLLWFVVAALAEGGAGRAGPAPAVGAGDVLEAIAFLFVAYTGYGRIATLGEEVRDPQRVIPRAVIVTLAVSAVLYLLVGAAGVWAVGPQQLASLATGEGAPLAKSIETGAVVVEVGAMVAMLGVLLNLVLGLSRVWLALGRRGDAPAALARLSGSATPTAAVVLTGVTVALVAAVGDVRTTWSFSAFAVLLYYGITNLAALRLAPDQRFVPRWVPLAGLVSCLFLSFWVDRPIWLIGVAILAIGLLARLLYRR